MAASQATIRRWFEEGITIGATHMGVARDDFDHDDYPVYVSKSENAREKLDKHQDKILEVYSLSMDMEQQLDPATRVFNYD